jgi:hypothetical protein
MQFIQFHNRSPTPLASVGACEDANLWHLVTRLYSPAVGGLLTTPLQLTISLTEIAGSKIYGSVTVTVSGPGGAQKLPPLPLVGWCRNRSGGRVGRRRRVGVGRRGRWS